MSFIISSYVFLTLLLAQVLVSQSATLDEAQAALNQMQETLGHGVTDAFSSFINWSEEIDSVFLTTKSNGTIVIQGYADSAVDELESTKRWADSIGIDITSCIEGLEGYIRNLGPENINSLIQCVDGRINDTLEYVHTSSMDVVNLALKHIKNNEQALVYCGKSDSICLSDVTTKIQEDTLSVLSNIVDNILPEGTKTLQDLLESLLYDCGERYTQTAEGEARAFTLGFEMCVDDILSKK